MEEKSGAGQTEAAASVKVVPAAALRERVKQTKQKTAQRAYEIFASRGYAHGRDLDDWLRAESEVMHRFPHTIAETASALVIFAQLPGTWDAAQLVVGVEPRQLIVSGEREIHTTLTDASGTHTENSVQTILRVLDLPTEIEPAGATASLSNNTLEISMHKRQAAGSSASS